MDRGRASRAAVGEMADSAQGEHRWRAEGRTRSLYRLDRETTDGRTAEDMNENRIPRRSDSHVLGIHWPDLHLRSPIRDPATTGGGAPARTGRHGNARRSKRAPEPGRTTGGATVVGSHLGGAHRDLATPLRALQPEPSTRIRRGRIERARGQLEATRSSHSSLWSPPAGQAER